jgi:hypothetical protein
MIIYRFRVTTDEQEDFLREIDIQPTATFLSFHEVIQASSDLDICDKAFFYTTDRKYKKHQEISFKPHKKALRKYDNDLDEIIIEEFELHLMKDSKLKDFIEDPHQQMLYEYYGTETHVFHVALFKIMKVEDDLPMPRCSRKTGEIPRKSSVQPIPDETGEEEDQPKLKLKIPPDKEKMLAGITENEEELAEIERHLEDFIGDDQPQTESPAVMTEEGSDFHSGDEDIVESVGDYDDLENIEMNQREFDGDTDDF